MRPLIGIEIGGTKLQVVVGAADGTIDERIRLRADADGGGAAIRQQIAAALTQLTAHIEPTGVGVGFGGPIDAHSGVIARSNQVHGWAGFNLQEWLTQLTGLAVATANDANAAALAEARAGAGSDAENVFYVTLGSGVGGGFVQRGALFTSRAPGESEIGLMRLDRQGRTIEDSCAGWAVDRKVRDAATADDDPLRTMAAEFAGSEARALGPACAAGSTAAADILDSTANDLAFGLSHVTHLYNPDVIVLGGGLSLMGECLRRAVAERLPAYIHPAYQPGPEIRCAALGEDVVAVGALLLAADLT
jgi:glucokinase